MGYFIFSLLLLLLNLHYSTISYVVCTKKHNLIFVGFVIILIILKCLLYNFDFYFFLKIKMLFKKIKSKQHLKKIQSNFFVLFNFFDSLVYDIIFFDYNEKIQKHLMIMMIKQE
jgi:hypothetical protein